MKFKIKALSIYEKGNYRDGQEDYIFPSHDTAGPDDRLFMVCDGMGGHEAGEVASKAVCETMSESILSVASDPSTTFTEKMLNQALSLAFDQLDARDPHPESEKKMGTTMTLLKFHAGGVMMAHIGDSRIYQFRPNEEGKLQIVFRTEDHSLVNDLLKVGELTPEEAKNFPRKNVITRAMQANMERRPHADIKVTTDVCAGDYFFLCSDGMLENATDENLEYMIGRNDLSDEDKVMMLKGNSEDNHDNHSAYLVHVLDVEQDSQSEPLVVVADGPEGPKAGAPVSKPTAPVVKPASAPSVTPEVVSRPVSQPVATSKPEKRNYLLYALAAIAAAAICIWLIGKLQNSDDSQVKPKPDIEQKVEEQVPAKPVVPQKPTEHKQQPATERIEAVPVGAENAQPSRPSSLSTKVNDIKERENSSEHVQKPDGKPENNHTGKVTEATSQDTKTETEVQQAEAQSDQTPASSDESSLPEKVKDKIKERQEGQ